MCRRYPGRLVRDGSSGPASGSDTSSLPTPRGSPSGGLDQSIRIHQKGVIVMLRVLSSESDRDAEVLEVLSSPPSMTVRRSFGATLRFPVEGDDAMGDFVSRTVDGGPHVFVCPACGRREIPVPIGLNGHAQTPQTCGRCGGHLVAQQGSAASRGERPRSAGGSDQEPEMESKATHQSERSKQ